MNIDCVKLENGQNYGILKAIQTGGNRYLLLANIDNEKDKCIRKVVNRNGEDFIEKLASEAEFKDINMKLQAHFEKNNNF